MNNGEKRSNKVIRKKGTVVLEFVDEVVKVVGRACQVDDELGEDLVGGAGVGFELGADLGEERQVLKRVESIDRSHGEK